MHEHMLNAGLINMNGRIYDPVIGRMLSPDNYVQDMSNPQNYSRYTYVLNNPLKYIDPSGELVDGYTIDLAGNIEWVGDTGGDDYDVLYRKDEYSRGNRNYDYKGTDNSGIRIDDTDFI